MACKIRLTWPTLMIPSSFRSRRASVSNSLPRISWDMNLSVYSPSCRFSSQLQTSWTPQLVTCSRARWLLEFPPERRNFNQNKPRWRFFLSPCEFKDTKHLVQSFFLLVFLRKHFRNYYCQANWQATCDDFISSFFFNSFYSCYVVYFMIHSTSHAINANATILVSWALQLIKAYYPQWDWVLRLSKTKHRLIWIKSQLKFKNKSTRCVTRTEASAHTKILLKESIIANYNL